MRLVLISLLLSVTLAFATPVERKDGPMVVDIPAGIFPETEADDALPMPSSDEKDTELIQPAVLPTTDSLEDDKKTGDGDDLGFRVPTIFVIRRPMISERFPFFQQSPFFGSSSLFENRRPFFERPSFQERTPVTVSSGDNSEHAMLTHMEQMMKRMQQQMSSLWGSFANPSFQRRPLRPLFPSLSFESGEDSVSNENETITNLDNLPPNYSNTTSETKVVDGHVVQVNKTIHKISSGNNTRGFFHFEVINVRPTEGAKEAEAPIPDYGSEPKPVDEIPDVSAEEKPKLPKVEDPSLNEVGESKPKPVVTDDTVSGVDEGLLSDDPKVPTTAS